MVQFLNLVLGFNKCDRESLPKQGLLECTRAYVCLPEGHST